MFNWQWTDSTSSYDISDPKVRMSPLGGNSLILYIHPTFFKTNQRLKLVAYASDGTFGDSIAFAPSLNVLEIQFVAPTGLSTLTVSAATVSLTGPTPPAAITLTPGWPAKKTFAAGNVNTGTEKITFTHGFDTGQRVYYKNNGGTALQFAAPNAARNDFYIGKESTAPTTEIYLYETAAKAAGGQAADRVDITNAGSTNHDFHPYIKVRIGYYVEFSNGKTGPKYVVQDWTQMDSSSANPSLTPYFPYGKVRVFMETQEQGNLGVTSKLVNITVTKPGTNALIQSNLGVSDAAGFRNQLKTQTAVITGVGATAANCQKLVMLTTLCCSLVEELESAGYSIGYNATEVREEAIEALEQVTIKFTQANLPGDVLMGGVLALTRIPKPLANGETLRILALIDAVIVKWSAITEIAQPLAIDQAMEAQSNLLEYTSDKVVLANVTQRIDKLLNLALRDTSVNGGVYFKTKMFRAEGRRVGKFSTSKVNGVYFKKISDIVNRVVPGDKEKDINVHVTRFYFTDIWDSKSLLSASTANAKSSGLGGAFGVSKGVGESVEFSKRLYRLSDTFRIKFFSIDTPWPEIETRQGLGVNGTSTFRFSARFPYMYVPYSKFTGISTANNDVVDPSASLAEIPKDTDRSSYGRLPSTSNGNAADTAGQDSLTSTDLSLKESEYKEKEYLTQMCGLMGIEYAKCNTDSSRISGTLVGSDFYISIKTSTSYFHSTLFKDTFAYNPLWASSSGLKVQSVFEKSTNDAADAWFFSTCCNKDQYTEVVERTGLSDTFNPAGPQCRWWNSATNDWDPKGCVTVIARNNDGTKNVECICDRASDFAILLKPVQVVGRVEFMVLVFLYVIFMVLPAIQLKRIHQYGKWRYWILTTQLVMMMFFSFVKVVLNALFAWGTEDTLPHFDRALFLELPHVIMFFLYQSLFHGWAALYRYGTDNTKSPYKKMCCIFAPLNLLVVVIIIFFWCVIGMSTDSRAKEYWCIIGYAVGITLLFLLTVSFQSLGDCLTKKLILDIPKDYGFKMLKISGIFSVMFVIQGFMQSVAFFTPVAYNEFHAVFVICYAVTEFIVFALMLWSMQEVIKRLKEKVKANPNSLTVTLTNIKQLKKQVKAYEKANGINQKKNSNVEPEQAPGDDVEGAWGDSPRSRSGTPPPPPPPPPGMEEPQDFDDEEVEGEGDNQETEFVAPAPAVQAATMLTDEEYAEVKNTVDRWDKEQLFFGHLGMPNIFNGNKMGKDGEPTRMALMMEKKQAQLDRAKAKKQKTKKKEVAPDQEGSELPGTVPEEEV